MSKLTYEEEGQTQEMPTNFGQKLASPWASEPPVLSHPPSAKGDFAEHGLSLGHPLPTQPHPPGHLSPLALLFFSVCEFTFRWKTWSIC